MRSARALRADARRRRARRLKLLAAAVVATLVAVPAIALSRPFVERAFDGPADPAVRDYIGRVLGSGTQFAEPPRYVGGARTSRGLVLVWAAGRGDDGGVCTGVEAAFGASDTIRMHLAGRSVADDGIACSGAPGQLGPQNAGLQYGQGLGSVRVAYGQVPARVQAVRVTFENGRTRTALAEHGWVVLAFEGGTKQGRRPILVQALDDYGRTLATEHLDPWDYGGREPPAPPLDGPGSALLASVAAPGGRADLRLSVPGSGWQARQCFGLVADGRSTDAECAYPAAADARPPGATNLYLAAPLRRGVVIAVAARIDRAWLVTADGHVRKARTVRFRLAGTPRTVALALVGSGHRALAGVVTTRRGSIVGALLLASGRGQVSSAVTPPCFLIDNGHAPTTPACVALMSAVRRAGVLGEPAG